jgi:signal transduction histidine kinase
MYGERDDPYGVLSRMGGRLGAAAAPQAAAQAVVETIAGALGVPYAAIEMRRDDEGGGFETAAAYGNPTGEEVVVGLSYAGETIGRMLLAPRGSGQAFSPADERLLGVVARQAEVAVQAARLTADLRRSRERLVNAREEERRRLRRDLHDGVGPQLAALNLELETASELVADNPEASIFIAGLSERAREAVADVRRSVHGLRPPSLDELGLVEAVKETAARLSQGGLEVFVEAPDDLPPLPAAVEVAAYRIAQEAMTNTARHARASQCRIRLRVDGAALNLGVEDDGVGLGGARAGVGMSSMRERAEELGGRCSVGPSASGGTLVHAVLPFPTAVLTGEGCGANPVGAGGGA